MSHARLVRPHGEAVMATAIFDEDLIAADNIIQQLTLGGTRDAIAMAIASERQRCYEIAMAIDSGRGNERQIAAAIMFKAGTKP